VPVSFPMIKFFINKKLLLYGCCTALVIASVFVTFSITGKFKEKKKRQYIGSPQTGDVYLIKENKKEEAGYYFLKVAELWEDSIIVYHSSFEYSHAVKELDTEDYFVLDEQLIFTKSQLQQMMDNNEISMVERDYGNNEGFDRMKY
jgi:hypothetical protein